MPPRLCVGGDSSQWTRPPYERLRPVTKLSPEPPWPEPWSLYLLPMHFRQSRGNKNLLTFLDLLIDSVAAGQSLHSYTFFEQYYIHPNLTTSFTLRAPAFMPVPGIGVWPEQGPPRLPTPENIEALDQKRVLAITGEKKQGITLQDFFPDLPTWVYWIKQNHAMARQELVGEGGWSFALSPLDEQAFFKTTKALMFKGGVDEALQAMPVVAPLLGSSFFMGSSQETLRPWFETFVLYLGESPQEGCMVIASQTCLDELLVKFVKQSGLQEWRTMQW
jgi:hypothetical protein